MLTFEEIKTEEPIRIVTGVEAYMIRTIFSDAMDPSFTMMFEQNLQVMMCGYDLVAYRFNVNPAFKPFFVEDYEWLPGEMYMEMEVDYDRTIESGRLIMFSWN